MAEERNNLIAMLLEQVQPALQKRSFRPLAWETGFISDQPDAIHLFVLYVDRVGPQNIITVRAAIQFKPAERIVSTFLNRPPLEIDEATIGQSIEVVGKRHWVLATSADIDSVSQDILTAFQVADAFFEEYSSPQKIAEFLLSRPIEPFSAQRILACAYLLKDVEMFNKCRQQVQERFEGVVSEPDANPHVKTQYVEFNALAQKLAGDQMDY